MTSGRAIDWSTIPLGTVPDGDLARQLGVTRQAIVWQRNRRRIPAARMPEKATPARLAVVELDTALAQLLDSDRLSLSIATAGAVDLVSGWAVEMRRSAKQRMVRVRFKTGVRRSWSDWMTPRKARRWLVQAGWADAAMATIEELRAKPEEATA